MTTGNEILVARLDSVISVPLECVHTEGQTTFVYKKNGGSIVKQEVKLGLINDNGTVIQTGIDEKDELLLTTQPEAGKLKIVPLAASN